MPVPQRATEGAGPVTTTLLIYDIPDDRLRARVADACLDYGLTRVQYSAFRGELTVNRRGEILQRLRRLIGQHPARITAFPICEKDIRLVAEVITAGYVIDR